MSFLDRFKPQPRWKHADAAVRAAAVADIPEEDDEHRDAIDELTRDEDLRVRRAAAARVTDPAALVALVRAEGNVDLRRELAERLVAIATSAHEEQARAATALAGLDDARHVSTVAKSSPHEAVRAAALARIHEPKALGSVARHAADPATALEAAVARLTDLAELRQVALRTEHKDAGVAALERCVADAGMDEDSVRELLDTVQTRAKSKAVSKRARAMLQSMQEAEAARRAALEQWQQRVASVVARVEAIAANPAAPNAERELADVQAEWRETGRDRARPSSTPTPPRATARSSTRREPALPRMQRAEAEQRAAAEHAAALRAVRLSLCERLEHVAAEQALSRARRRARRVGRAARVRADEAGGPRSARRGSSAPAAPRSSATTITRTANASPPASRRCRSRPRSSRGESRSPRRLADAPARSGRRCRPARAGSTPSSPSATAPPRRASGSTSRSARPRRSARRGSRSSASSS